MMLDLASLHLILSHSTYSHLARFSFLSFYAVVTYYSPLDAKQQKHQL